MWLEGRVLKGDQTGRTIGFPTINLLPAILDDRISTLEKGVHAAWVKIDGKLYRGALYFGPRVVKDETNDVLEIHILDFDKEVYGDSVSFQIKEFIRPIMDFESLEDLKDQIAKDILTVSKFLLL